MTEIDPKQMFVKNSLVFRKLRFNFGEKQQTTIRYCGMRGHLPA
jgi:hypothetical protein